LELTKIVGKVYLTDRKKEALKFSGSRAEIKDLHSTEIVLVEDMPTFAQVMGRIGQQVANLEATEIDQWEFLTTWPGLSVLEKLRKYEKFGSHELNLFLYFKDRTFFNNVVKKHLPSKKEKEFIDHFLLEDIQYFEELLQKGKLKYLIGGELGIDKIFLAFYALTLSLGDRGSERARKIIAECRDVLQMVEDRVEGYGGYDEKDRRFD
jgi:hypothetical protein